MSLKISMAAADLVQRLERHGVTQALPPSSYLAPDRVELWFDPRYADVIQPIAHRVAREHGLKVGVEVEPGALGVKLRSGSAAVAGATGIPFSVYAAMALTLGASALGKMLRVATASP